MAENSLQNQKKEVSFVLSEKAKAIIDRFEEKLREGNYTAEERNGIRAELVWRLLGKQYPEIVKRVENIETTISDFQAKNAKDILCHFRKDEPFLSVGSILLYSVVSITQHDELIEKKQLDILFDEVFAVLDYYLFVIFNYDAAYKVFGEKFYELCVRLYGHLNNVNVLHNNTITYPLWWILLNMDNYLFAKQNHHVPNGDFDLVVLNEDMDSSKDSSFELNGKKFVLQDFVEKQLSETGFLFYKASDTNINKTSWDSFRKWIVENRFLHGVIQLPRTKDGGQILVISKQPVDFIYFVDARNGLMSDDKLDVDKTLKAIQEKKPEYYKELSFDEFISCNSQCYTFVSRQFSEILASTPKEGENNVALRDLIDLCELNVKEDVQCYFLNRPYYIEDDLGSKSYNPLEAVVMPCARIVPNENFFLFKWDEPSESFLCSFQTGGDMFEIELDDSTGIEYKESHDSDGNPVVCTYPNALVFKLKDKPLAPVNPYYLAKLFYSDQVISQMEYYKLPYSDVAIDNDDFLSIQVILPSLEEQQRIVDLDKQEVQKTKSDETSNSETVERIKVLWIDDESKPNNKVSPSKYEIEVTHKKNWKEAERLLENREDFYKWSAIIIGPSINFDTSTAPSSHHLAKIRVDLEHLCSNNNSKIPWYVLTEGNDVMLSVICEMLQYLREPTWGECTYTNNKEQLILLFETIRKVAPFKSRNRVIHQYIKVFEVIREYFEPQSENIMTDILSALHHPEDNKEFKPVLYYNSLRQMVEYLFRAANKLGLLPDIFFDKRTGKILNVHQASLYLAGKSEESSPARYGNEGEYVFPSGISNTVKNILNITNSHSHTTEIDKKNEAELLAYYSETHSPNLLFGYALQLCEVIIWFGNYAKSHSDKDVNLEKCKVLKKETGSMLEQKPLIEEYEGKTLLLEKDDNGNLHCHYCMVSFVQHKSKVNKMVRLRKVVKNTNPKAKDKYPFFANEVVVVDK